MRVLHVAAFMAAAVLLAGSVAGAQSLGETAAREREKRKGKPQPAKVFTEEDLRTSGGNVAAPAASDTLAPAEGEAATTQEGKAGEAKGREKTPEEVRAEQEQDWRQRLETASTEAADLRTLLDRIQLDLNDTSGGVYTPRRAALQTRLEETQKALAAAQQKVADLQEEGRRNSFR